MPSTAAEPAGGGGGYRLRAVTRADADDLARMTAQQDGRPAAWLRSLELQIEHPRRHVVVAECGGQLVGFGRVTHFDPLDPGPNAAVAPDEVDLRLVGWHLAGIVVDPIHRRRGLGRRLVLARLEWLAERTDEALYVTACSNVASRRLHAACGFEEVAEVASSPFARFEGGRGVLGRRRLD